MDLYTVRRHYSDKKYLQTNIKKLDIVGIIRVTLPVNLSF